MANKYLNTRILLKYDILGKVSSVEQEKGWVGHNPVLLKGEIAVAAISAGPTKEVNSVAAPQVLFKVGDGVNHFNDLPWASGLAADVYAWAKKANPDYNDLINKPSIPVDTNTTYKIEAVAETPGKYKFYSKEKGGNWDNGVEFGVDENALKQLITTAQSRADAAYELAETKADAGHNHDDKYLGINAKAADAAKLNGQEASYYATDVAVKTAQSAAEGAQATADKKADKTAAIGNVAKVDGHADQIAVTPVEGAAKATITINDVAHAKAADAATNVVIANNGSADAKVAFKIGTGTFEYTVNNVANAAEASNAAKLGNVEAANYALKSDVESAVAGAVQYYGVVNKAADLGKDMPSGKTVKVGRGDFYRVGTGFNGFKVGDLLIANKDNAGSTVGNYDRVIQEDYNGTVTSVEVKGEDGVTGSGTVTTTGSIVLKHADTSAQATVTNTGRTYIQSVELDKFGHVTKLESGTETVTDSWRDVNVNGTQLKGNGTDTGAINFKNGSNVTISGSGNDITINAKDTVYSHPEGTAANKAEGFYKISTDETSHVKSATAVGSQDIIDALGYTPYNATNPNGYTTNKGTVTSVTGGAGLTGSVSTSGSLAVGAGTGITVNADDVAVTDYNNIISAKNANTNAANAGNLVNEAGDVIFFCCGDSNC